MKKTIVFLFVVMLSAATYAGEPIVGVWKYERTHMSARDRETNEPFERVREGGNPRIFIFTERHYSYIAISGDEPRPLRREAGEGRMGGPKVPDEQRLAEYRPLDVETGTWVFEDDVIVLRPMIDHVPDYMLGDGQGDRRIWAQVDADVLVVTRKTEGGATIRDTYSRLE